MENSEILFSRTNGEQWTALFSAELITIGTEPHILVVLQDISKQKLDRKKLEASEERFRTTMMSIGDGVMTTDTQGRLEMMNPVAETLTGWKQLEAQGKLLEEIFQIVNEETRQVVENPARRVMRDGNVVGLANHTVLLSKNGKEIPIADSGSPIRNAGGSITGVVLVFRDQTEERRVQKDLQESNRKLRRFYDSGLIGAFYWNMNGKILDANDKFLDMFGYTREELVSGKIDWINMTPPEFHECDVRSLKELKEAGVNKQPFEKAYFHKDGRQVPIVIAGAMLDEERFNGIAFVLDISEQKKVEEKIKIMNTELEERVQQRTAQLENSNKELEAFAYSVSHDLRAPLRHIDGFIELLQNKLGQSIDETSAKYVRTIGDSAKQMASLIDDLLSFSRMGRTEMFMSLFDLTTLVREVIRDIEPDRKGRNVRWIVNPLPRITADPTMLRLALTNLLGNAQKFSRNRDEAVIEIGTIADSDGEHIISIRDNGVGFNMKYAHKLFGVFQRLHNSDEFEGTGIGLANVRRIISRHGGRTWAEGTVDEGATFYFSLPISNKKTRQVTDRKD